MDRHHEGDALCRLIAAMAHAKLKNRDAARREYNAAMQDLAARSPVLYGSVAPCAVQWLSAEAAELLSLLDETHTGELGASTLRTDERLDDTNLPLTRS